jgi:hypothetical protein
MFCRDLMKTTAAALFCQLFFAASAPGGTPLSVADFEGEPLTQQGGAIAARQRVPSAVKWRVDEGEAHGGSGKSIRIEYIRLRGGDECHLLLRIPGVDLAAFNALTFWVKGSEGGEIFDVGLTNAQMDQDEKLPPSMMPIEKSLPGGVTTDWQKVTLPLDGIHAGGPSGSVVIAFNRITKYSVIYLDDIQLEPAAGESK